MTPSPRGAILRAGPVVFLAAAILGSASHGFAQQALTPGNLVVVRVGDGTDSINSSAAAVSLLEVSPTGALVQTINLPSAGANEFTLSGSLTTDGALTLAGNGQSFTLGGYRAALGDSNPVAASSSSVPRVIASVALNGTVNTGQGITDAYSSVAFQGATTDNGSRFWLSGANGGVRFVASASATTSTSITGGSDNVRSIFTDGSNLFVSSASNTPGRGILQVGSGLPAAAGQGYTASFTPNAAGQYHGFYLTRLGSDSTTWNSSGFDTIYAVNTSTRQLEKWSYTDSGWSFNGSTPQLLGLTYITGVTNGSSVTIYATTNQTSGQFATGGIDSLTDNSGFNQNLTASFGDIGPDAAANYAYRGIAIVPVPEPSTSLLIGLTAAGLAWRINRRARRGLREEGREES